VSEPEVSDALRLLCGCAAWAWAQGRPAELREHAGRIRDWGSFVKFAMRHRLQCFADEALEAAGIALPPRARQALKQAARDVAGANLLAIRESKTLLAAFGEAGIAVLDMKGLPLAILAYGECTRRHGKDIDLFVQRSDFPAAGALMEKLGYVRTHPRQDVSGAVLALWMRRRKDFAYSKGDQQVELHWQAVNNPLLFEMPWRPQSWQTIDIGHGLTVETAASEDLFAYLCVHGAIGGWFRLKWVCDIAGLLARQPPERILELYTHTEHLGIERASGQVLLLCADLFGTPLPPALSRRLRSDAIVRFLERVALGRLASAEIAGPVALPFATLWSSTARLLLRKGLRYKFAEIATSLADPAELPDLPFAERLIFLYPVLRPFVWLGAQWRKRGRLKRRTERTDLG